jgi:hypothetical protein
MGALVRMRSITNWKWWARRGKRKTLPDTGPGQPPLSRPGEETILARRRNHFELPAQKARNHRRLMLGPTRRRIETTTGASNPSRRNIAAWATIARLFRPQLHPPFADWTKSCRPPARHGMRLAPSPVVTPAAGPQRRSGIFYRTSLADFRQLLVLELLSAIGTAVFSADLAANLQALVEEHPQVSADAGATPTAPVAISVSNVMAAEIRSIKSSFANNTIVSRCVGPGRTSHDACRARANNPGPGISARGSLLHSRA